MIKIALIDFLQVFGNDKMLNKQPKG